VLCQTFRKMLHHVVKIELICNLCEHSFQLDTFIEKFFYYSRLVVTSTPITGNQYVSRRCFEIKFALGAVLNVLT
jgi:hypothetical protein